MTTLTADQILERIGSFGRYQLILLICANVIAFFWFAWPILVITFVAAEPGWRCVSNSSECKVNETVYPGAGNYYERCNMSREAWKFDAEYTSVVTEFDLVCDKALYGTIASSLVFIGSLFGSLAFSTLSDKFGRRIVIYSSGFLVALFGLLSAFPNVYWLFAVFRFIVGITLAGGVSIFILISEFVGVRKRSMMGTALWCSWSLSLMVLSGLAYLIRDWRLLCIVTTAPAVPFVIGYFFTPESPRWLIVKGKTEQALKLCKKAAKINGKVILWEEQNLELGKEEPERLGDIRDLFGFPQMAKTTLISWYCWFVNAFVYYGVYLSTPTVGGDMYLNFFLTSAIEIPAIPVGIWIYNRFGRKRGVIIPMLLAAAGAAGSVLLTTYDESNKAYLIGKIALTMVWAKFWIMVSYDGIYVYSGELFPTVIRNIGMGSAEAAASIGSFCSPYIIYLQRVHPILPYGIMGLNALMAGALCVLLPETRYQPTLETTKQKHDDESLVEAN